MDAHLVSPLFVGRRPELAVLEDVCARARDGRPGFILISGEAGVGKSRFVEEYAEVAASLGMRVLVGHCVSIGAESLPFAPLLAVLRDLIRASTPEQLASIVGSARVPLGRLLPDLDPDAGPAGDQAGSNGSQLFGPVLGLLERLSAVQPLVLVLEDLHWADQSTLELTGYLARALRGVPVLVIATYRSDELHRTHPLRQLVTGWERIRSVHRLELARFDRSEVETQLQAILGEAPDPALVDVVFERSEGNAFLVEELVGVVRAGGRSGALPPSLRDLLLARVETLTPATQRLLRTAAVAGRSVPESLLMAVIGPDTSAAFGALHEAVEHSLLTVDDPGRGYAFRHALARDAVYDELLPGERVALHAAYAQALADDPQLGGDDPAAVAAALAHHWSAALDLPRTLVASVDAARYAANGYAPATALHHLERALEVWPRVPGAAEGAGMDLADLLRLAAQAAYRAGALDRSLSLLDQAVAELADEPVSTRRAALVERQAQVLRDLGRNEAGIDVLERAMAELTPDSTPLARAILGESLAAARARVSDMHGAQQMAMSAIAAAQSAGAIQQEADARNTLASTLTYLGETDEGLRQQRAAVDLAERCGAPESILRGYINLSDLLGLVGRHEEAGLEAAHGVALAEQLGLSRTYGSFLVGNLVEALIQGGDWRRAEGSIEDALAAQPEGVFGATLYEMRAQIHALCGRYDEAEQDVRAARAEISTSTADQFSQPLVSTAAEILRARGDLSGAARLIADGLREAGDSWQARYAWPLVWQAARVAADAQIGAHDRRDHVAAMPPESVLAKDLLDELPLGTAPAAGYRALARAERSRPTAPADVAPWATAVQAWRTADQPYPLAYALFRLAEAHCAAGGRAGAREAAQESARESVSLARALGAAPLVGELLALARRARLELDEASAGPSGRDPVEGRLGPVDELARFGLTGREREVLDLVAAGRSNQQIADQLYISRKTASVHVSRILAKLQVTGRVEAAAMVHRLSLPAT